VHCRSCFSEPLGPRDHDLGEPAVKLERTPVGQRQMQTVEVSQLVLPGVQGERIG
jgi:hypothetical protein